MVDIILLNQLNLILQIIIIAIFLFAIFFKLRQKPLLHGRLMLVAFILNAIAIGAIMLPLLIGALPIIEAYTDSFAWILIIHHSIGLVAFVLSLFLVARFAYARFTVKLCCGKWLMRTTAVLWGIALVLGLYLYLSGYIV